MKSVIFHFVQVGLVLAGAHSQLKEITTDNRKEINKRSIITLDSGLKEWKPSMPELVKRYDTLGMKGESVASLYGRMPRSESVFLISDSQHKSRRAVSEDNERQSGESKINQLRKRSHKIKIKYSSKTHSASKFGHKPQVSYKVKTKIQIKTKGKTKKHKSVFKKVRKVINKLFRKKKYGEKTTIRTIKTKTTIKHY